MPIDRDADQQQPAARSPGGDELERALRQLRFGIRSRLSARSMDTADLPELFATLRRRFGTLGMTAGSVEIDDFGMDDRTLARATPILDFLGDHVFRIETLHADALPETALFVANRAADWPHGGLLLAHWLARSSPGRPRPRFLCDGEFAARPFVAPQLTRLGGVRAHPENALRLLRSGRSVIAFPGVAGASPGGPSGLGSFGRGGLLRTAAKASVPIVAVGMVGPESLVPQPGASGWGLPTPWVIAFGEPLHCSPDAAGDELWLARSTESLRRQVGEKVDEARARALRR